MGFSRKSSGLCKNPDGIPGKEGKNAGKFGEVVRVSMEFQRSTVSEIEYPQQGRGCGLILEKPKCSYQLRFLMKNKTLCNDLPSKNFDTF